MARFPIKAGTRHQHMPLAKAFGKREPQGSGHRNIKSGLSVSQTLSQQAHRMRFAVRHGLLLHAADDAQASCGDTIPDRLGDFREIRESNERIVIVAYGHLPGTPGATGLERLVTRANGQRSAEASGEKRIDFSEEIAWFGYILKFGDILNMDGPLVEIGSRSVDGSSQRGRVRARPDPAGGAWGVGREAWGRGAREQWPGGRWGPTRFLGCQRVGGPSALSA